ncbi:MAG: precorrin-3B C(17)-methyltransferase, partial [Planctomycetes bacterium]|nr:precorrin-3B C(17)-methyltransferase [Planctomycetota bacterium]
VGTLDTLQEYDIGMLTTVLIGNSATVRHGNLLVTPRGYRRKYDLGTAQVRRGVEKAPVGGEWSLEKGRP